MKTCRLIIFAGVLMLMYACNSFNISNGPLSGEQSAMGEVGNEFIVSVPVTGVENGQAVVTELEDGISTISYSATITNPAILSILETIPDVVINNGVASCERQYRITENGFQSVYEEGNLNIVNYNSIVGDTYTLKRGSETIKRKVTSKSTDDDYPWGWFNIKVIKVEETGRKIPGVSKVEFIANHRWGMVGLKLYMEDGTETEFGIFSDASN